MALPSSGAISMSQVNTEIGASSTAQISLNDSAVRSLFGKASGAIAMSDGYGKSSQFAFTVSSNTQNANLRTLALAAGWNGSSKVVATVASGVYLWSDSTATAGLIIDGSWPGGVELINNGYIMGRGGNGCGVQYAATNPVVGGPAISLSTSCTITTSGGYIGGGGGGGGGLFFNNTGQGGGGGAGGGTAGASGAVPASSGYGGVGGSIGNAGGSAATYTVAGKGGSSYFTGGGGGGRIMPGSSTASAAATSSNPGGTAGGPGNSTINPSAQCRGGTGGAGGVAGSLGYVVSGSGLGFGGGGGGWGAAGGNGSYTGSASVTLVSGAAGGKAVALNGNTVTWVGGFPTGRVFGAVS